MDVLRPLGGAAWVEVDGKTAALRYVAAGLGIAFVSLLEGQQPSHPRVVVRDVSGHFPLVAFHLVRAPPFSASAGATRTAIACSRWTQPIYAVVR